MARSRRANLARATPVVIGTLLLASSSGVAATPRSVLVSTTNPYAGCTLGGDSGGHIFTGSRTEPDVAVNPRNPNNIIAVYQQDRWNDGGSRGDVAGVSHDGGKSFHDVDLPFSACAPHGLRDTRASDPWISFGPDGVAYAGGNPFDPSLNPAQEAVAVSFDGGDRWTNVHPVVTTFLPTIDDKDSVTADPVIPGTAYATWDTFFSDGAQPVQFRKTVDHGAHWGPIVTLTAASPDENDTSSLIVVDPRSDKIYDTYWASFPLSHAPDQERIVWSTDGGTTWSSPVVISEMLYVSDVDPHPGGLPIRAIDPAVAIDPQTGQLYVVWEDARFTGKVNGIVISTSATGAIWTRPRLVSTITGADAFTPEVAVNSHGDVAVTYYDLRTLTLSNPAIPTSYWIKVSPPGGTNFGPDMPLVAHPFDLRLAPDAGGLFLGDYQGLTNSGTSFVANFVTTTSESNPENPTVVFVETVKPPFA